MKANEFRIGNFVTAKLRSGKGREIIHKITGYNITNLESDITTVFIFQPIPLTEEWLLKFGFRVKENDWYSIKTKNRWIRFEISLNKKRCILFDTKEIKYCDKCFVNYIHQIQNLYFALVGEELTINANSAL
jgi:hypothetical protein